MLLVAMVGSYKIQNYINAASFARRILELPEASSSKNEENRVKAAKGKFVVYDSEPLHRF
jgi:hypothetical protein